MVNEGFQGLKPFNVLVEDTIRVGLATCRLIFGPRARIKLVLSIKLKSILSYQHCLRNDVLFNEQSQKLHGQSDGIQSEVEDKGKKYLIIPLVLDPNIIENFELE